ncbi:MAG: EAL domain-containing protein [Pseudomonadota bacterium]
MFRSTRFRTKLLIFTLAPLAIVQFVTFYFVLRTVQQDVTETARASLLVGTGVAEEFLSARSEQLSNSAVVLASDFGLKEAAATQDADTIRSVLQNHSRRVGAAFGAIVDRDGALLGSTSFDPSLDFTAVVEQAEDGQREFAMAVADVPFQLVVVPLRAPTTIGWVALGFPLDRELETQLSSLTGLDVSLAGLGSKQGLFARRSAFDQNASLNQPYLVSSQNDTLLSINTPFSTRTATVLVVMQRSMREVLAPYNEARRNLLLFGAVLLLVAVGACAWLSSTVSEPLKVLGVAARQMMSGNYRKGVSLDTRDEFGQLADSFNAMRKAISDRERHISHFATHDALTDLPNISRTLKDLDALIARPQSGMDCISVLSVHLSRMAEISSTLGHSANDELIRLAAQALVDCVGDAGSVYHIGTNEFAIVLPGTAVDCATGMALKIQERLDAGTRLGKSRVILPSVVGIAKHPEHSDRADELLRFASIARVQAESKGVRCGPYHLSFAAEFTRRLQIVNDIPRAIRDREFQVWYQPKAGLPDGQVHCVESLIRWIHPDMGFLSPDDFIPAAEKSGLIVELSRYVIDDACRSCRSWESSGHHVDVAVNLSTRDLMESGLTDYVQETLARHGLAASRLTLEVTESAIMEDIAKAVQVLNSLRDLGVKISMDDFGTGHSSLAQLRQIPLDELKIDKAFIDNLATDAHNSEIVRTVVGIAHGMRLEVVAEGVEDETTARLLAAVGCERIQGYFLSKPLPAPEFIAWLQDYVPIDLSERRSGDRAFTSIA